MALHSAAGAFGVAAGRWRSDNQSKRLRGLIHSWVLASFFPSLISTKLVYLHLFWIEECPFSSLSSSASAAYPSPLDKQMCMRCNYCMDTPFPFLRCCYTSLNASPNRARAWIGYNSIPQWPSHCPLVLHWPALLTLWHFKPWRLSIFQLGHEK